jgi:alkaline phosphatase D
MTIRIDRRSFLLTGSMGLGAFAVPGLAQMPSHAAGFTHSVASGEPSVDSILLWTRYVPTDGDAVELKAEISETADFAKIISGGAQITGPWRDHTAKITVSGLAPGRHYHFRFVAPDGSFSPIGRTRTLPEGPVASYRVAIFSCSNMSYGYSTPMPMPQGAMTSISPFILATICTNIEPAIIPPRTTPCLAASPNLPAS